MNTPTGSRCSTCPPTLPSWAPPETVWSLLKHSMVNLLATDLDDLASVIKHRLKVIQHRGMIDGYLAPRASLSTPHPPSPINAG